jgi:hypothetical protein
MTSLIEKLYSNKAVELIRDLYYDDVDAKESFYEAFGNKILEKQDVFLDTKALDLLMLICNTAKFAYSLEECHSVAFIIHRRVKDVSPLPYLLDDHGINLAEKSFISLSFFYPALEKRWKKGAPSPAFYRNCAKKIFAANNLEELADHHEQWEAFFSEIFV